jgi:hypothetical protein
LQKDYAAGYVPAIASRVPKMTSGAFRGTSLNIVPGPRGENFADTCGQAQLGMFLACVSRYENKFQKAFCN